MLIPAAELRCGSTKVGPVFFEAISARATSAEILAN